MALSNQPPKGMDDWLPIEYAKRKYIFDIYRRVCNKFGYLEYMTPMLEYADVYRAKSGADVGGKELFTLTDKAGRDYAIRPEMTPSVTRMVSRIYESEVKPIRLFSIANFLRNEKPQRGRAREFWQLNYDLFGVDTIEADIEVVQISLEIMLAFKPPQGSFTLFINNRRLINYLLDTLAGIEEDKKLSVVRILDKWEKLAQEDLQAMLLEVGLTDSQVSILTKFMQSSSQQELLQNIPQLAQQESFLEVKQVMDTLTTLGYGDWIQFKPNVIRGFDYYDRIIFEVFDNSPENNRSLFGGGTYNGLASIFGVKSFPATGAAPGELPVVLFLETWDLFPQDLLAKNKTVYVPLMGQQLGTAVFRLAAQLRSSDAQLVVETGVAVQGLGKALDYANKKNFDFVAILGEDELVKGVYLIKDMQSGEQTEQQFTLR